MEAKTTSTSPDNSKLKTLFTKFIASTFLKIHLPISNNYVFSHFVYFNLTLGSTNIRNVNHYINNYKSG